MALYKDPQPRRRGPDRPVEKHFHDHDEIWFIMGGKARASMVDRDGAFSEFILENGDIWVIEAGVEHACEPLTDDFLNFPVPGTIPEGSHVPGHYFMEEEGYLPTLVVRKAAMARYGEVEGRGRGGG